MRKLLFRLCLQPPLTLQGCAQLTWCSTLFLSLHHPLELPLTKNFVGKRLSICHSALNRWKRLKKPIKLTHTPDEAKEELATSLYLQISNTWSQRKSHPNSSMFLPILIHTLWFPFAKTKEEAGTCQTAKGASYFTNKSKKCFRQFIFKFKPGFVSLHVKQIGLRPFNLSLPRIKKTSQVSLETSSSRS